jgi:hypothetical protein
MTRRPIMAELKVRGSGLTRNEGPALSNQVLRGQTGSEVSPTAHQ